MNYCTVENIKKYFNVEGLFSSEDDNLNKGQLEDMITNKSAYIDMKIGKQYTTPLTDVNDLLIVKDICEKLVVSVVDGVLDTESDEKGRFRKTRAQLFIETAEKLLNDIASGKTELPGSLSSIPVAQYVKFEE